MKGTHTPLNYHPEKLKRELKPFYIGADDKDISDMLKTLGLNSLDDLYKHIASDVKMTSVPMAKHMAYEELIGHVNDVANKNNIKTSFLGDGLPQYKVTDVVGPVCDIRGLTTAYTPYQPERSQGTLQTLWIYQSLVSQLTGFEAVNASLYDRSTCLYEAMNCALRLVKDSTTVVVANSLYPGDLEVIETHAKETEMKIIRAPINAQTGKLDIDALKRILNTTPQVAAVAFPQVNNFGNIESVDEIVDLCSNNNIKSIAVVDPMLLGRGGLKAPAKFGVRAQGADMVVAEGQHLAIGPNFGGPGLGIFGIRYNEQDKISIRSTAGRYVGKTQDLKGRECKALILSTREQHIRREKATSNICSNQSFVATAAGASMLARGDEGFEATLKHSRALAEKAVETLTQFEGVELKFKGSAFFNEFTLKLPVNTSEFIHKASAAGIQVGVDVSNRHLEIAGENLLMMSFTDIHSEKDLDKLVSFFASNFEKTKGGSPAPKIQSVMLRTDAPEIPRIETKEIIAYYERLGKQNLSPDDGIYPLGSCTMKYNPYINDYAASLPGFTNVHPQAPVEDIQGCLEILFEIQEQFKAITGLPGVVTQAVAGAQGELVGLKMFQAYHRDRGEGDQRNVIIIPRSAHGTNPATATMAGYQTKMVHGQLYGIYTVEALPNGEMNLAQIKEFLKTDGHRVAGVMVTNPNTAGIFETQFKEMSDLIHGVGGLVYMDGANMNAIAGILDLDKLGVDAVHNNLHKTWTIPHGGGGPGDAIVGVSHRLLDFIPGVQIVKKDGKYDIVKPAKSCGSFHRHFGNFAHKIRAYTYIKALGADGVRKMSQVAVLSARYLHNRLSKSYPTLPAEAGSAPRMHEFILTLSPETFKKVEASGTPKTNTIARIGKLFLDFGFHAPTVAFPEQYGLMIEPTETYSKNELDQFSEVVEGILKLINEHPEVLKTVPHFTPIDRVDEVLANKNPVLSEKITDHLPDIIPDRVNNERLRNSTPEELTQLILKAHQNTL
ncbi:aminomethyl-transferring glycine dehydrogenase subunit GcvPB [Peredibacter starrii]|uniref:glycine dehydrogenase (aminomethyl-transferring) n=1 Tax=Peredibacter starrii TaxID=28202 RepID=A0AAX4HKA2_9BACT|nr:aminomethyl-transferring glycine dehydrogenase subunit GcvPB [Peredibacter starrii]WPU63667.1 aminomethyl-transferring glycine dehydrogenase subunit GcvPB [Peredibacter starrii]